MTKKNNTLTWIIVAAVIIVLVLGYIWYSKIPSSIPTNPKPNTIPTENTPVSNENTYNIDISNLAFSPSTLTIKQGETVIWTNSDSLCGGINPCLHTVTSDKQNELSSKQLKTGEVYSHTFNTPGTFDYHCEGHPNMKANIIVE